MNDFDWLGFSGGFGAGSIQVFLKSAIQIVGEPDVDGVILEKEEIDVEGHGLFDLNRPALNFGMPFDALALALSTSSRQVRTIRLGPRSVGLP